ncbi:hypothetical protein SAMN02745857_03152 [Andreprevotia lacus DSM 23236]|jgi:hypothetical protein|uniref:Uncharacterized protein n=1 Tax=Andreprevotia lacus DSM 23236 TaxID=1121001 RepID=A0A1W1XWF5_9NEIS|nr:hypothetical protein [Andreprevotia lacus]SMC28192.1 hypothetical protein SAMN02745857_03152 [Andreprevotia lacus DSM 23236]
MKWLLTLTMLATLASHAWADTVTLDVPAGAKLQWNEAQARIGKTRLYQPEEKSDECESENSRQLKSAVGPVVSFMAVGNGYCKGAAHPWASQSFEAYDSRTGKLLPITALFDEATVLTALKQDKLVRKALAGQNVTSLKELAEKANGECEFTLYGIGTSYAFHHIKDGKVAVRFGLSHGCEAMRGNFTQLGVYLPIPPQLKPWLDSAEKRGLLMNKLDK